MKVGFLAWPKLETIWKWGCACKISEWSGCPVDRRCTRTYWDQIFLYFRNTNKDSNSPLNTGELGCQIGSALVIRRSWIRLPPKMAQGGILSQPLSGKHWVYSANKSTQWRVRNWDASKLRECWEDDSLCKSVFTILYVLKHTAPSALDPIS